jgi:hypothetical protein
MLDLRMNIASRVEVIRDIQTIVVQIVSFFNVGIVDINTIIRSFNELKFEIDVNVESELKSDEKEYFIIPAARFLNLEGAHVATEQKNTFAVKSDVISEFEQTSFSVNIESDSNPGSDFTVDEETNKYQLIAGIVSSSSGTQFKDLPISSFANVQISAVSSSTFETSIPTISGTGTSFTTDFVIGDALVADDQYFIVVNVFNDTALVTDRDPSPSFTNVPAYKQI